MAEVLEVQTGTKQSRRFAPPLPHTFEDLGVSERLIADLFLRRVYTDGTSNLRSLSASLRLSPALIHRVFRHVRDERLLDIRGAISDDDYTFSLTTAGTRLAENRMQVTQYVGPAPVSLRDYSNALHAQTADLNITAQNVAEVLSDLVTSDELLHMLGPALVSQKSLFLYGPTGNGKTAIAERLHRVYEDAVLIPYAVEVDGQIIILYDPIVHRMMPEQPDDIDPRWVLCRRPFVVVGGEMTADMLELRFDDASRTYAAPVQMKANNGMLVVDDFGRQAISPQRMLNRWIVPMDRRVEFLSLRYGVKFEIPFELMLIFATNIDPYQLADEAFLRRLHNKIYLGAVTEEIFDQIFWRFVTSHNLQCDPDAPAYVRSLCLNAGCTELRACLPGDICAVATWVTRYEQRPNILSAADFDRAVKLYFARTQEFEDTDPIRRAA